MYVPPTTDAWLALYAQSPRAARKCLWYAVRHDYGLALPYKRFSPGHSTPFDFVADAFFRQAQDVAAWACRSGGKTLGASVLVALDYQYGQTKMSSRVLSGSLDQGNFLYAYWRNWCEGPLASKALAVQRHLTSLVNGDLEILSASEKKVRGGKVQRLYEDELDEVDQDIDEAAAGMIATRNGIPGRTVYTSTWHRVAGMMGRLVEGCPENGVALHKWNIWEAIQRCPASRHDQGRNCADCPFGIVCVAKAREFHDDPGRTLGIAAQADGIYGIDDCIKAFRKVSRTTWEAEYECKRPSAEGLVYPAFDEGRHVVKTAPADLAIYRVIDWGANFFVCLWIGEDKDGTAYILDTYRAEQGTIHQHADHILAHRLKKVRDTYCDPAGRNKNDQTGKSNVQVFAGKGITCHYTLSPRLREVRNGIQMVRALLDPATGRPKLYTVATDANRTFTRAMQSYLSRKVNGVWIDEPQDPQEYEHIPDALRYYVVNRQAPRGITRKRLGAS